MTGLSSMNGIIGDRVVASRESVDTVEGRKSSVVLDDSIISGDVGVDYHSPIISGATFSYTYSSPKSFGSSKSLRT